MGREQLTERRGDELLAVIRAGGNGDAANGLLAEFFDGYPLSKLRLLLHSTSEDVVEVGSFIASELGARFAPLMGEVPRMLAHPSRSVRFDALDVVLDNEAASDGTVIAQAIALVNDPDSAVRWKTLRFLSNAARQQLESGMPHLVDTALRNEVVWLLGLSSQPRETVRADVLDRLSSDDSLTRRFAAVAAARLAPDDPFPLQRASSSADPEVEQFAQGELKLLES